MRREERQGHHETPDQTGPRRRVAHRGARQCRDRGRLRDDLDKLIDFRIFLEHKRRDQHDRPLPGQHHATGAGHDTSRRRRQRDRPAHEGWKLPGYGVELGLLLGLGVVQLQLSPTCASTIGPGDYDPGPMREKGRPHSAGGTLLVRPNRARRW